MSSNGTIRPILRVPTDETIYCGRCDQVQPAYAHIRTRELYCAICDAPYDEDVAPEDYEPWITPECRGVPNRESNSWASLATRCSLLATMLLALTLGAAAQSASSVPYCDRVLARGQTVQQSYDAAFAAYISNPHALPELVLEARAAKVEFDSLCLVDARLGTDEAHVFIDQETARIEFFAKVLADLAVRP